MKKCPYCAEEIQDEAVVCRFCNFDLKTGKLIETSSHEPQKVEAKSSVEDGVRLGCGMFIVLPLIILGIVILLFLIFGGLTQSSQKSETSEERCWKECYSDNAKSGLTDSAIVEMCVKACAVSNNRYK